MKDSIVVIRGGIGNQMFQYAFGKILQKKHNTRLCLDISFFDEVPERKFGLDAYDLDYANKANYEKLNKLRKKTQRIPIIRWIVGTYKESKYYAYDPIVFKLKYKIYMGYWQNLKYLEAYQSQLRDIFSYQSKLDEKQDALAKKMKSEESIAVHIRRGDYLSPQYCDIYCLTGAEYYKAAIADAKTRLGVNNPPIYVFSDDIAWCKENLDDIENITYIDGSISDSPYVDMELMKNAQVNINANSTFSWWSAWLNDRENHFTYVPTAWYKNNELNERAKKAIIPKDWIII